MALLRTRAAQVAEPSRDQRAPTLLDRLADLDHSHEVGDAGRVALDDAEALHEHRSAVHLDDGAVQVRSSRCAAVEPHGVGDVIGHLKADKVAHVRVVHAARTRQRHDQDRAAGRVSERV